MNERAVAGEDRLVAALGVRCPQIARIDLRLVVRVMERRDR
jgi:hypothetical protein